MGYQGLRVWPTLPIGIPGIYVFEHACLRVVGCVQGCEFSLFFARNLGFYPKSEIGFPKSYGFCSRQR